MVRAAVPAPRPSRRQKTGRQRLQRAGDRKARMDIRLCQREARTSENGPPLAHCRGWAAGGGSGVSSPAHAGGWQGARGAPPRRRAGRGPGTARVSVHEAGRRRHHPPGPAAAHRPPHTPEPTPTERSSSHRRPTRLPPPAPLLPTPRRPNPPPPSASPRWLIHRSHNTHQPTHHTAPAPLPPPRPRTTSPRLGWPAQVYLAGRGRGSGAKRRTPFLAKPRREAKETPEGGAAACCAQGRNP
jgi:hypothetical protein